MHELKDDYVSDWRIAGSSGWEASVETPVVNLSAGGGLVEFPLINKVTNQNILVSGPASVVSIGLSTPNLGLISGSGSLSEFPSNGLGKICRGPLEPDAAFVAEDFTGVVAVISGSMGSHASFSSGIAIWLNDVSWGCLLSPAKCQQEEIARALISAALFPLKTMPVTAPGAIAADIYNQAKAIGALGGLEFTTSTLQAGISISLCKLSLKS